MSTFLYIASRFALVFEYIPADYTYMTRRDRSKDESRPIPPAERSRLRFLQLSGGMFIGGITGCSGGAAISPSGPSIPASNNSTSIGSAATLPAATVILQPSVFQGAVRAMLAGLSYEKNEISSRLFASGDSSLIACFSRLGKSVLRLGGNSVDQTVWNASGAGGVAGEVAPSDIDALASFVKASNWNIIYGINLATGSPSAAAAEAAYASAALSGNLLGFEIGNEPDLYKYNGLRPSTYTASVFTSEWLSYVSAIRGAVPGAMFVGPATSYNVSGWTAPFVASAGSNLELVTHHYYRGNGLDSSSTMALLLGGDPALSPELQELAAISNGTTFGYRLGECNSFYNGGATGISDAFGSALWAVDFMLLSAQNGCSGLNFHGGGNGGGYTPIADKNGAVVQVRPVYYAMLLVSQISPGKMYALNVLTDLALTAYAIAGADGATYFVVINKEVEKSADVSLFLGKSLSQASALFLSGQGQMATSGTTLGNSSVSSAGAWSPTYEQLSVATSETGVDLIIPASTACLIKCM